MNNRLKISFPSKGENERLARTVCAAFIIELDPTIEEMSEIKTAISEAVTNSIIHAYSQKEGDVEIIGEISGQTVTYIINDKGCGIGDINKAKQPLYSSNKNGERSGMGFSIMEAFMDKVEVISKVGEGTTIIMSKRISVNE